jgi:hypothetical protein
MRTIRVLDAAQAAPQLQDVAGAVERKGIDMTKSLKMAGYAAMLMAMQATASAASAAAEPAGSVREGEGVITRLGVNVSAVTYWVTGPEGWRVVTTVDTAANEHSNRDAHAIVRFSSSLLPGQSQLISVPVTVGEVAPVLRIRRLADGIEVTNVSASD